MARKYELTEKQDAMIASLKDAGFEASWWGRSEVAERIYFRAGRRDVKVYIEFDEPQDCWGAALKIFIDDCGQSPKWYASQKEKLRERFQEAFQIVTGQKADEVDQKAVTEAEAEALQPGQRVSLVITGPHNGTRPLAGVVTEVKRVPTQNIGEDECVEVLLLADDCDDKPFALYTWRGVLRYGSGAEVVLHGVAPATAAAERDAGIVANN